MTRVLFFGSRNLTWKHLQVMKWCAWHAILDEPMQLLEFVQRFTKPGGDPAWSPRWLPDSESLVCIHGDGPPGKVPGAIGADKLSELACMEVWPERKRLRRFPVEQVAGESWAQAAARRDREAVAFYCKGTPRRAYVVHTDLDSSAGSIITANELTMRGERYAYVRVTQAGALVSVEER